ncbi:hypothetical protein ACVWWC_002853 [Thermostichus sp. MS-CIW-32]|jgi:hypothetical protein
MILNASAIGNKAPSIGGSTLSAAIESPLPGQVRGQPQSQKQLLPTGFLVEHRLQAIRPDPCQICRLGSSMSLCIGWSYLQQQLLVQKNPSGLSWGIPAAGRRGIGTGDIQTDLHLRAAGL